MYHPLELEVEIQADGEPQAYISVRSDISSATIVLRDSDRPAMLRDLAAAGARAKPLDIRGRFHHPQHRSFLDTLRGTCASNALLRFPASCAPLVPLRRNDTRELVSVGDETLHETCLRCILRETADWHATVTASIASISKGKSDQDAQTLVVGLGLVDCFPQSLLTSEYRRRIRYVCASRASKVTDEPYLYPDSSIAIVGVACRFPGGASLQEFWDLIRTGGCTLAEIPERRFSHSVNRPKNHEAEVPKLGNFIDEPYAFDHRFFHKSAREAMYMDPQQRIALQVAYQAVESSGHFNQSIPCKDIGCFVGFSSCDYERHVESHAPTAFSFTGTAPAFISGRISHHFGWTGPSMVINTACSSSGVAVHSACRAIQAGDCTMALAGGVNVIASQNFHQDLSAATLLNHTGPCRTFDAGANGYSRGEGCGFVFLKLLSTAIADNDDIWGVVVGSSVNQNNGNSPITTPESDSQVELYRKALSLGNMNAHDVSFMEAHGTGTPRGDPIECRSIRRVFGNEQRLGPPLYLGSIKANIGHAEGASGVAGLIKVLLMMRHRTIPPQINFKTLNPAIPPLKKDGIHIPTETRPWSSSFLAACISNYSASGNNTAMVLCQPPPRQGYIENDKTLHEKTRSWTYPILICAQSSTSLRKYCSVLQESIATRSSSLGERMLPSLAYQLFQKQNLSLERRIFFKASTTLELQTGLERGAMDTEVLTARVMKPCVLVFAGQTGETIYLAKEVYQGSSLLREHLDRCDGILQDLGLNSLYPGIFNSDPVPSLPDLHCQLFSLQYACAKSWLDAGLKVVRVVGHSLGQLTALCVAGVIDLYDALRLVLGRAALLKKEWQGERGVMLRVDADIQVVRALIEALQPEERPIDVACYNGSSTHVLSGCDAAIRGIERQLSQGSFAGVRIRRLKTTHAYHSQLVNCIMPQYEELARSIIYHPGSIPIETCSENESWASATPELMARQTREPVYFHQAVTRVHEQLGGCVWIEAGSGSTGVTMTSGALGKHSSSHSFHPVRLNAPNSIEALATATMSLWAEGLEVQFWLYHRHQRSFFQYIDLPPYQFENSSHWLPPATRPSCLNQAAQNKAMLILGTQYQDGPRHVTRFVVPKDFGYCPATRQNGISAYTASFCFELASQALNVCLTEAKVEASRTSQLIWIESLRLYPYTQPSESQHLSLVMYQGPGLWWEFSLRFESGRDETIPVASGIAFHEEHNSGRVSSRYSRIQRLVRDNNYDSLLKDPATSILRGSILERVSGGWPGLAWFAVLGRKAITRITVSPTDRGSTSHERKKTYAWEQIMHIAETHVNWIEGAEADKKFSISGVDETVIFPQSNTKSGEWNVVSQYWCIHDSEIVGSIIVFDTIHSKPVMTLLGTHFSQDTNTTESRLPWNGNASAVEPYNVLPTPGSPEDSTDVDDIFADKGLQLRDIPNATERRGSIDPEAHSSRQRTLSALTNASSVKPDTSSLDTTETNGSSSLCTSDPDVTKSSTLENDNDFSGVSRKLLSILNSHMNLPDRTAPTMKLSEYGLDSFIAIELASDIEKCFGIHLSLMLLDPDLTLADLTNNIISLTI